MFVSQVIVLFLLPYFTTSHPSHKRETNQVSISKSSQNVINDGTPVNSEPVSSSPHTAALSYHHLKEVIENSVSFLNRRSASSVIVDSSSAFHSHEKISLGKAPSDTTNLEAPTILVDGSMNRKVESHVTSTKSIKSSIKTAPTISKRFNVKSFRPSNWNWKWNNFRNWGKLKNTNPMTGAANHGLQRTQSMPNLQGTQGYQPGQVNQNRMPSNADKSAANQGLQRTQSMPNLQGTQEFQPGQVNQNRMPSNAVKINNENKAGTTFINGLKSRWQKLRGQVGSQASLKNNANVVQGNSPTASSAIASDKSSVQIAPMRGASNEKNLNRPAFDSEDSQTESYSGNRNSRSKAKSLNSPGLFDLSDYSSEGTPKTHNRGKKNNNPNTPNYISSSNGESGSSSSAKRRKVKSTPGRLRRKKKSPNADSRLPETNSVSTEKIISPGGDQTRNSLGSSDFSDSSDAQSEAKSWTHNKGKKNNNLNIPIFNAGNYYSSTDNEESDSSSSLNLRNTKSTINRPKKKINLSDIESRPPETNSVNTEKKISPVGDKFQNPEEVTQIRNVQFIDQKSEPPHEEMDMLRSMDERTTNPQRWNKPPHDYSMDDYEMGGREEHGGYYNGRSTGSRVAHAIENTVPLVSVLTGIATGKGNMGRGAGGYGNDYENMDAMGGLGMGGYGSSGYGPSGYGASGYGASGFGASGYGSTGYEASGYGAGGSMGRFGASGYGSDSHGLGSHGLGSSGLGVGGGSFGANELDGSNIGGDPVDAHDPLDETRSKAVEKSTSKRIRKPKKNKNGPKTDAEIDHEGDEKDTHNKSSDHTSKNIINNDKNKNDTISIDNDKTGNKVSSEDSAKNSNNPVSRLDV